MHEGLRSYKREREKEEAKLVPLPPPGKKTLVEKVYGQGGAPALDHWSSVAQG